MGEMTLHFYVTLPLPPDFYSGTVAEHAEILKDLRPTLRQYVRWPRSLKRCAIIRLNCVMHFETSFLVSLFRYSSTLKFLSCNVMPYLEFKSTYRVSQKPLDNRHLFSI